MTLLEKLENDSLLLFVVFEGTTKLLLQSNLDYPDLSGPQ